MDLNRLRPEDASFSSISALNMPSPSLQASVQAPQPVRLSGTLMSTFSPPAPRRKPQGLSDRDLSKFVYRQEKADKKPSEISEMKRAAFDKKRLAHIRLYLVCLITINVLFQIQVTLDPNASLRQRLAFGLYWIMTIIAVCLLALGYRRDDSNYCYFSLVIVAFRNVLPLFDLDGVSLPMDDGNTSMLLLFQAMGCFMNIMFITLHFRKSSFAIAVVLIIMLFGGEVRSCYSNEQLLEAGSQLVIIIVLPVSTLFLILFFRAEVGAYEDFFQEIVNYAELSLQLETILNNLEEAIIIFSRGDTLEIDFANQLCEVVFQGSALLSYVPGEQIPTLEEIILNNLDAKVFREYRQEEDQEVVSNLESRRGTANSEQLSLTDLLGKEQAALNSCVFRIIAAASCDMRQTRLIRYVQIKSKSFVIEGQTKTAVQIIDISKSILYDQVKAKSEFHSLMNATVSHEMRNPLNSIINQNVMLATLIEKLASLREDFNQLVPQRVSATCGESEQLSAEDQEHQRLSKLFQSDLAALESSMWKVQRIHQSSSKSMRFLVNDILDFARIKQSKFKKDIREFNIAEAIQEIIDIQQYQADSLGIQFCLDLGQFEQCPKVKTDQMRLQQVIQNLVSNSLKFTTEGSISIKAAPIFEGNKWFLKVYVVDTGCGIKKEDHHKIFKLFGTFDRTNGQNTQGIGLGLVICKTIVEEFGGQISFKSRFGHGCMFSFTFELTDHISQNSRIFEQESIQCSLSCSSSSSGEGNRIYPSILIKASQNRVFEDDQTNKEASVQLSQSVHFDKSDLSILIVDDQVFNLEALEILLSLCGIQSNQVTRAFNGEQALKQAESSDLTYDLIFMDCNMPFMDGYEATQKIRKFYEQQNRPQPLIAAVTGHSEDAFKQRAIESGMNKLISKPASKEEIAEILAGLLQDETSSVSMHSERLNPNQSMLVSDSPAFRLFN